MAFQHFSRSLPVLLSLTIVVAGVGEDDDGSQREHPGNRPLTNLIGAWRHLRDADDCPDQRLQATAHSLMTLLSAGYDHRHRSRYRNVVTLMLTDLHTAQDQTGRIGSLPLTHILACEALWEAYALSGHPAVLEPAERALRHMLVLSQHGEVDGIRARWWSSDPDHPQRGDTRLTMFAAATLASARLLFTDPRPDITQAADEVLHWAKAAAAYGRNQAQPFFPAWYDIIDQQAATPARTIHGAFMLLLLSKTPDSVSSFTPTFGPEQEPLVGTDAEYDHLRLLLFIHGPDMVDGYHRFKEILVHKLAADPDGWPLSEAPDGVDPCIHAAWRCRSLGLRMRLYNYLQPSR